MKRIVKITTCAIANALALWLWVALALADTDCGDNYFIQDAYRVQDFSLAAGTCLYRSNSSAWIPSVFPDERVVIYSGLVDFKHTRRFIIVSQNKEMKDSFVYGDSNDGYYRENSNPYYYWIIDKRSDEVYGPMTKAEYIQRRRELKVPFFIRIITYVSDELHITHAGLINFFDSNDPYY